MNAEDHRRRARALYDAGDNVPAGSPERRQFYRQAAEAAREADKVAQEERALQRRRSREEDANRSFARRVYK